LDDDDGDGLPNGWEQLNGLDPEDAEGINGPAGDPDGDGLNNLWEHYAGTNPWDVDTDGDGYNDADSDSDDDGLVNLREQNIGTMPHMKDTDDDGLSDGEEETGTDDSQIIGSLAPFTAKTPVGISDPLSSLDPPPANSLALSGNGRLVIPSTEKYATENWTIALWVSPSSPQSGVIFSRHVMGDGGVDAQNYEIGVNNIPGDPNNVMPYVRYTTMDGTIVRVDSSSAINLACNGGIPVDEWTHLTATYDWDEHRMELYINGELAHYRVDPLAAPAVGLGLAHLNFSEVTLGARRSFVTPMPGPFFGFVDELKLWRVALGPNDIRNNFDTPEGDIEPTGTYTIPMRSGFFVPPQGIGTALAAKGDNEDVHAIVQFEAPLSQAKLDNMTAQGIETKFVVSDNSIAVKGTKAQIQALDDVRWSDLVKPNQKISKKIDPAQDQAGRYLAVQFFPGTAEGDAVAAATGAGANLHGAGYVDGTTYLVVEADDNQVDALANHDSVAWVFNGPKAQIEAGLPIRAYGCNEGHLHAAPFVTIGEGWDGPGLGSADITYHFVDGNPNIANENQIMVDALNKWAAVAALTFTETPTIGENFSFDIYHTPDPANPFDGPGGVLAYAFLPNDIASEPIAGNAHYDPGEGWVDVPSVDPNE
ncbi:MAG: LamG-like jellyroll fold domain-containing protein, partial [Verrucomicrobiota bacterium]